MKPIARSIRTRQLGGYVCHSCTRNLRRSRRGYATTSSQPSTPEIYDVVCVGGGPAGLSLLAALRMSPRFLSFHQSYFSILHADPYFQAQIQQHHPSKSPSSNLSPSPQHAISRSLLHNTRIVVLVLHPRAWAFYKISVLGNMSKGNGYAGIKA
jgi:hypothetical protein